MSKNKKKTVFERGVGNYSVSTLMLDKQIKNIPVCRVTSNSWVNWGARNRFPFDLLDLVSESPTLNACINFAVTALVGGGIDYSAMNLDGSQVRPNYRYSWDEFLRRCSRDFFIFSSFAFQVIKNRDGVSYSFYHQPMETVRCSERDEDGLITSYWICDDWSAPQKNPPIEVPSLIMRPDEEWNLRSGEVYLYVFDSYQPTTNGYYSVPCWQSAIKSVMAEVEMTKYDLRQATSSFTPAGMLSLPAVDTEDQKRAILEEINKLFVGAENANALMTVFRSDNGDGEPVSFTPFTAQQDNVDLYSNANNRAIDRIMSSFGIPQRSLIGLPEANSAGFNSEADLLRTSFELYQTLAGNHARESVVGVINDCFRANGIDVSIELKPLSFFSGDDAVVEEKQEDDAPETNQNITEDNIIEQEQ